MASFFGRFWWLESGCSEPSALADAGALPLASVFGNVHLPTRATPTRPPLTCAATMCRRRRWNSLTDRFDRRSLGTHGVPMAYSCPHAKLAGLAVLLPVAAFVLLDREGGSASVRDSSRTVSTSLPTAQPDRELEHETVGDEPKQDDASQSGNLRTGKMTGRRAPRYDCQLTSTENPQTP